MGEKSTERLDAHIIKIEVDEHGRYIAECTDLPGCISDGATKQEALLNITDAIDGYLKSASKHVQV